MTLIPLSADELQARRSAIEEAHRVLCRDIDALNTSIEWANAMLEQGQKRVVDAITNLAALGAEVQNVERLCIGARQFNGDLQLKAIPVNPRIRVEIEFQGEQS